MEKRLMQKFNFENYDQRKKWRKDYAVLIKKMLMTLKKCNYRKQSGVLHSVRTFK